MKKTLALLLALLLAVGLTACAGADTQSQAPALKVTDLAVDIPEGFEATQVEGFEFYYVNAADNSNVNMNSQEKGSADDAAFDLADADTLNSTLVKAFKQAYELEVDIEDLYFTRDSVGGFPAYQYAFRYDLSGTQLTQLIVSINADKIYTITYTDTTGDWLPQFERSAASIQLVTEEA